MKNFKKIGLVLLTLTMVFALAACGGGDSGDGGDSGSGGDTIPASESTLTADDLSAIKAEFDEQVAFENWGDTTYEDMLELTGNVEAEVVMDESGNYDGHYWYATDSEGPKLVVEFSDWENGKGISLISYSAF